MPSGTVHAFLEWYENRFKKTVLKLVSSGDALVAKIDPSRDHLVSALNWSTKFEVGLIGQSQIGKSTLINAILSDPQYPQILPAGGIGPLTAQIIEVEFSERRKAEVTYHAADKINNLVFSLEKMTESEADDESLEQKELADRKKNKLFAEATHLVTGNQHLVRSKDYLISVLKSLVKKHPLDKAKESIVFVDTDGDCYHKIIQSLLAKKEAVVCTEDSPLFKEFVRTHASGCLAPLVKTMKLGWPSDLTKHGVSLVDLPGIGVFNDSLPEVTQEWIKKKGRSVVLVMRNNGLDNEAARTLRESGFLTRLLFSWEDRTDDPVQLILAITQMDVLVQGRAMEEREDFFRQEFKKCSGQVTEMVRVQLSQLLESEINSEGVEEVKEAKRKVAERIISEVQIMPLSALQYIYTITNNKRREFDDPEETNVPALVRAIRDAAIHRHNSIEQEIERRKKNYCAQLSLVIDQLLVDSDTSVNQRENLKALKSQFSSFSENLGRTLVARQGAFKTEITKQIPDKIENLMLRISGTAKESYTKYCRTLKDAHWNTLKAAIRRGGTYIGARKVDIRGSILEYIEEPIATKFSGDVIRPTRKAAINLTEAYSDTVKQFVEWISEQPEFKNLKKQVVLIQRRLEADKEEIESIGEDRLKQLKDEVRAEIDTPLTKKIESRCDRFINSEESAGYGVKGRMLELVEDMGKEAIDLACQAAETFLRDIYKTIYATLMQKDLSALKRDLVKEIEEILFGFSEEIKASADILRKKKAVEQLKDEFLKVSQ